MEKEVKKTRKTKKEKTVEAVQEEVLQAVAVEETVEKSAKKAAKKAAKPRAKKAPKKVEEVVETPIEVVEEPAQKTDEKPVEKVEEKPKKARKTTTKKAKKSDEKKEEKTPEVAEEKHELTRAEKKDAVRAIVKDLLQKGGLKRGALIDEASRLYVEKYPSAETVNVNDVKGRVGSVITLMEQMQEVFYVGGKMSLDKPVVEEKVVEEKVEEKAVESVPAPIKEEYLPVPVPEAKLAPVFDMSALLGEKVAEKAKKSQKKTDEKKEKKVEEKTEEKPIEEQPKKTEKKTEKKGEKLSKKAQKSLPQDKLKEKFLKKIRSHGGAYLEYYAIYLLQRYAQANGRRLEGLRVSGGKADGGIDGEIEVSDRLGFRETLYVQAKNWEPTDEKWMVGETLLQQFIGAVTYRMVQDGKTHGRGVYVTTSKFSDGARKMLDDLADRYVGYDGDELFDLAKECKFGVVQKDGEWVLDDNLLAGEKAFFNM